MKFLKTFVFHSFVLYSGIVLAQTQFPWPIEPFNTSHLITGSFCEYRSTSVNGHFHNGTDIPKEDGAPVYASKNGTVTSIDDNAGSSSYVRVNDLAYVHIIPNPSLSIGDNVVASQTVLGTIYPGQGHVHLTNGFIGSERNSLLPNAGLTPYDDPWAPIIRFVRFYQNDTDIQFNGTQLSGPVDIRVKIDEQSGPPGSSTSVLNNGTYKVGFKVLSEDTAVIVYEPPNNGLKFQFDVKPSNSVVNIVYYRLLSSTTSHVYQVTNDITGDNFWNTAALPTGNYVVMVFTEDTRQNSDTAYVAVTIEPQDVSPPEQPNFVAVTETSNGMRLRWYPNTDADLLGYRLYFSFDNQQWNIFRDETVLTPAVNDTTIPQILNRDVYFKLSAVDNAPVPNESAFSNVMGLSNGNFSHKVLVVDGFDRRDGGWQQPDHHFVYTTAEMLKNLNISFDAASNEAVIDGQVQLSDYEAVFWICGDEAVADESFSTVEQQLLQAYLQNGGKLMVSGSNIAFDLMGSTTNTVSDSLFLAESLYASFIAERSSGFVVSGVSGSIFEGLNINFGSTPYAINTSDVIEPVNGSETVFSYDNGDVAGIVYDGTAKVVFLAFPFETISTAGERNSVMDKVAHFFFSNLTGIQDQQESDIAPQSFKLLQNYPNPFNPTTTIQYQTPVTAAVTIQIFNALGQVVKTFHIGSQPAGEYHILWDGHDDHNRQLSSGIYFVKMFAESAAQNTLFTQTLKMLMLK